MIFSCVWNERKKKKEKERERDKKKERKIEEESEKERESSKLTSLGRTMSTTDCSTPEISLSGVCGRRSS